MKTMTRGLIAAAALASCFGAFAQVNVDDVKTDSIVPPGGIKLHGLFGADVLPLPPGSWKVLSRLDEVEKLRVTDQKFVSLSLQSTDGQSTIPFMRVKFNLDTANVTYAIPKCTAPALKGGLANDFASTSSQLAQRCATTIQIPVFAKFFVPIATKRTVETGGDFYKLILDRINVFANAGGEGTLVNFVGSKLRGRYASYEFILKTTAGNDFVPGNQKYEAVINWVQAAGDAAGEFLDGKTVALPGFKEPKGNASATDPVQPNS